MDVPRFDGALPFFPVRDLSATRDFYVRDLVLEVARDQGSCVIVAAGDAFVGFCQSADDGPLAEGDGVILTFVTDAVDAWYARLRRLGIETEGSPRRHPTIPIYHFFARDPDGRRIEVQRFDTPLP